MGIEILFSILGAVASILGTLTTYFVARLEHKSKNRELKKVNFRERIEKLSAALLHSSSEVDKTLKEIEMVTHMREEALRKLEDNLNKLENRKKEMQTRIDTLQNIQLPAVEYFLEMTKKSEKRSAARDYVLFGSGVIVSTIVTILLKLFFNI